MPKDSYYFSHDSGAQDDPKCMLLIDQMGMEGYGIFWALIEKLRTETNYRLPVSICGSLAKRWGTSKEKVEAVIRGYGLFQIEEDIFFSVRLCRTMALVTERHRFSANHRWKKKVESKESTEMRPHATALRDDTTAVRTDAIENKGKEIKGKESKGNKRKENTAAEREKIFEMMYRATRNLPDEVLNQEVDKFINFWHDQDLGNLGAAVNQWASNIETKRGMAIHQTDPIKNQW